MTSKCLAGVLAMLLIASAASWAADDGAALYKKKCGLSRCKR